MDDEKPKTRVRKRYLPGPQRSLFQLPLYASLDDIAEGVLGRGRVREFRDLLPLFQRVGFPKMNPLLGRWYVPAVQKFFEEWENSNQRAVGARMAYIPTGQTALEVYDQIQKERQGRREKARAAKLAKAEPPEET